MNIDFKKLLARAAANPISLTPTNSRCHLHQRFDCELKETIDSPLLKDEYSGKSRHLNDTKSRASSQSDRAHESCIGVGKDLALPLPKENMPAAIVPWPPQGSVVDNYLDLQENEKSFVDRFDRLCLDLMKILRVQHATKRRSKHTNEKCKLQIKAIRRLHLFRSVCICDPNLNGNPILHRSKYFSIGPKGLKVGTCEFANLNFAYEKGVHCELLTRPDVGGRPKFILEYANGLTEFSTGRYKWVFAAQIDVTEVIRDMVLRSLSESAPKALLEGDKNHMSVDVSNDDQVRYSHDHDSAIQMDENDDNGGATQVKPLGRLSMHPNKQFLTYKELEEQANRDSQFDWIEAGNFPLEPPASSTHTVEVDSDLGDNASMTAEFNTLLDQIKILHRSCFILSPNGEVRKTIFSKPTDSHNWKIAYMSQHLLSRFPQSSDPNTALPSQTLHQLGVSLSRCRRRTCLVNWGHEGTLQRVYCSPMLRDNSVASALCFLVDPKLPDLWDLEEIAIDRSAPLNDYVSKPLPLTPLESAQTRGESKPKRTLTLHHPKPATTQPKRSLSARANGKVPAEEKLPGLDEAMDYCERTLASYHPTPASEWPRRSFSARASGDPVRRQTLLALDDEAARTPTQQTASLWMPQAEEDNNRRCDAELESLLRRIDKDMKTFKRMLRRQTGESAGAEKRVGD